MLNQEIAKLITITKLPNGGGIIEESFENHPGMDTIAILDTNDFNTFVSWISEEQKKKLDEKGILSWTEWMV